MISIMHSYAVVGVVLMWYVSLAFAGSLNASTLQALHVVNGARYESFLASDGYYTCFKKDGGTASNRIVANTKESLPDMRAILPQLANQTILFVGDSLRKNQYVAFAALIWEADESCITTTSYTHSVRWNFTVALLWSAHILDIEYKDLAGDLSKKALTAGLIRHLSGEVEYPFGYRVPTILFLSTGHHWTRSKYRKLIKKKLAKGLTGLVDLDVLKAGTARINKLLRPFSGRTRMIWSAITPRHYEFGEWDTGGYCNRTVPYSASEVLHLTVYARAFMPREALPTSNVVQKEAEAFGYEFVDILPYAVPRCDGLMAALHRQDGVVDCSHYCLPGVPDVWNAVFLDHVLTNTPVVRVYKPEQKNHETFFQFFPYLSVLAVVLSCSIIAFVVVNRKKYCGWLPMCTCQ